MHAVMETEVKKTLLHPAYVTHLVRALCVSAESLHVTLQTNSQKSLQHRHLVTNWATACILMQVEYFIACREWHWESLQPWGKCFWKGFWMEATVLTVCEETAKSPWTANYKQQNESQGFIRRSAFMMTADLTAATFSMVSHITIT